MARKTLTEADIEGMIQRALTSRKYAEANIPADTLRDLILQEAPRCKTAKETEKAMREKLHQIMAPYLGDPDYDAEEIRLRQAAAQGQDALNRWCLDILSIHSSSRERIPVMETFFSLIFAETGKPSSILDMACAFDPFSFPWMGLSNQTRYYAYDLHQPRVHLINSYFQAQGLSPLAKSQDILLTPPTEQADMAFFFKEAHRFEARKKGCNRDFWMSLPTDVIVVTLPAENLTGQHQMRDRQRDLIRRNISGLGWRVTESEVAGEMIFIIRK